MRNLIRLTVFMFVVNAAVSCSGTPGYLNVQLKPEQGKVEYIRVFEKDKKHLARDLMPVGKGKYEAIYTNPTDVTVVVKSKKRQELSRDAHIEPGEYAYMEFNVASEKTEVEFIRMKASREFQFKPINKGEKKKSIYISYIDYIGQNLGLTKKLEENLKAMGYKVLKSVDDNTELIATVNLVDFTTKEHSGGVNHQRVNQYKFKIGIEQRISGATELQETFTGARASSEDITYLDESYPMDDTGEIVSPVEPTPVPAPVAAPEKPGSPGLLVLLGMAEDEKKEAEEAVAPAEDPAAAATAPPAEEKKEEKKEEKPAEEVAAPADAAPGVFGFQSATQVVAKSKLKYRPFKDEIMVDASLRLINLESRDEKAVDRIVELLSNRLAQIFNL